MDRIILGIDISKAKFDVAFRLPTGRWQCHVFDNHPKGFEALHQWIQNHHTSPVTAFMEATGIYGEDLALNLYTQGHHVVVVNPAQIKYFAQSKLSRAKTDRKDAQIIAEFGLVHPDLMVWEPPIKAIRKIRVLYRCLQELTADLVTIKNRLEACRDEQVQATYETMRSNLEDQIKRLEAIIRLHIKQDESLTVCVKNLKSIPGVAEKTAWGLLSEMPDVKTFKSAKQLTAYAGLTPTIRQSGTSVRGRGSISKTGSVRLRTLLYWPGIVATLYNPTVKALADRLKAKGKKGKVIIVAAMRKLLHIIFGVLKTKEAFCA